MVSESQIPSVPVNAEFTYLGRRFRYDLKNESAKAALEENLLNLLEITVELVPLTRALNDFNVRHYF